MSPLIMVAAVVGLGALGGDRLVERRLDDVAVIALPARVDEPTFAGTRTEDGDRLAWAFATTYGWASIGSAPAYRQLLFVSLMAPDATDADYERLPSSFRLAYDPSQRLQAIPLGNGTLTVVAGTYRQNTLREPSHTFVYRDRTRRLQVAWHSVDADVAPDVARRLVDRMAASFRIVGDPEPAFAGLRDRPRREARERADRRRLARDALARAGFADLVPGEPRSRDGVYVEWMSEPEPRFQLVKPLGLVHVAPGTPQARHPRPTPGIAAAGSVGWRERWDGNWRFFNHDDDYLPLPGIATVLAALQDDPHTLLFYYSVTVRVEEASREQIEQLGGFYRSLPTVEQAWREGQWRNAGRPGHDLAPWHASSSP